VTSQSFGQLKDPAHQGMNLMIQKIVQYMIRYRIIDQCLSFLLPLSTQDPRIVTYICDCYIAVDRPKDAVILLASKIKDFPYLVPLLLKQAEAFLKIELYEYAQKLAKLSIELCPESFEAHMILAKCLLYEKDIRLALTILNQAPAYQDASANWHFIPAYQKQMLQKKYFDKRNKVGDCGLGSSKDLEST